MRKLCDSVDRFCLQHPRFGIPNLMKFLVGIMAVVFVLDLFSNGYASYMLYFNAELVLQGELWRLVTWMFLPTNGSLFWIFISLSFYYCQIRFWRVVTVLHSRCFRTHRTI